MLNPCCPKGSIVKMIKILDNEVGIAGFDFVMQAGYNSRGKPDDEIKEVLLKELKLHKSIPKPVEIEYLNAIWQEYKQSKSICPI